MPITQIKNKADQFAAQLWPVIVASQDIYFAENGTYYQGLKSHKIPPTLLDDLTGATAPDNLDAKPSHQTAGWADFWGGRLQAAGITAPDWPIALTLNTFVGSVRIIDLLDTLKLFVPQDQWQQVVDALAGKFGLKGGLKAQGYQGQLIVGYKTKFYERTKAEGGLKRIRDSFTHYWQPVPVDEV